MQGRSVSERDGERLHAQVVGGQKTAVGSVARRRDRGGSVRGGQQGWMEQPAEARDASRRNRGSTSSPARLWRNRDLPIAVTRTLPSQRLLLRLPATRPASPARCASVQSLGLLSVAPMCPNNPFHRLTFVVDVHSGLCAQKQGKKAHTWRLSLDSGSTLERYHQNVARSP